MAKFGDTGELLKCSFCGKSQKQVKKLIAGPGVYICDECIDLCNEIIEEELTDGEELSFEHLPNPREIRAFLDDYVVGQDDAKKILAVVPPDLSLVPHEREVADVFEAPLRFLLDPANHRNRTALFQGRDRNYYEILWNDRRIWGIWLMWPKGSGMLPTSIRAEAVPPPYAAHACAPTSRLRIVDSPVPA